MQFEALQASGVLEIVMIVVCMQVLFLKSADTTNSLTMHSCSGSCLFLLIPDTFVSCDLEYYKQFLMCSFDYKCRQQL